MVLVPGFLLEKNKKFCVCSVCKPSYPSFRHGFGRNPEMCGMTEQNTEISVAAIRVRRKERLTL